MFLAVEVVVVGIFAKICLLADIAGFLEGRFCGSGGCRCLVCKHFLGEDFRGEGWEGSNAALEVVAMPVGLHVRPLQLAGAKCDLACVAGERMGRLDIRLSGDLRRHFGCCMMAAMALPERDAVRERLSWARVVVDRNIILVGR